MNRKKYQSEKFVSFYKQKPLVLLKSEEIIMKNFLKKTLEDPAKEVLFVGCGGGREIFGLLKKFDVKARLVGVDYSSKLIGYARRIKKKRKIKKVQFICQDIFKVNFKRKRFDAIILFNCFMDLLLQNQKEKLLTLLKKWVKRNGIVIFNVNKFSSFLKEAFIQLIKLHNPFIIKLRDEIGLPIIINPLPFLVYKKIIGKYFKIMGKIDSTRIDGHKTIYLICKNP